MRSYSRIDQITDLIKRSLATELSQASDPRFTEVTVTAVKVSNDLSLARVYVTFFKPEHSVPTLLALNKAVGFFRHQLAQDLNLRRTPALQFHVDHVSEEADHIEKLLEKIHEQKISTRS